jgi:hypothetical protein
MSLMLLTRRQKALLSELDSLYRACMDVTCQGRDAANEGGNDTQVPRDGSIPRGTVTAPRLGKWFKSNSMPCALTRIPENGRGFFAQRSEGASRVRNLRP